MEAINQVLNSGMNTVLALLVAAIVITAVAIVADMLRKPYDATYKMSRRERNRIER